MGGVRINRGFVQGDLIEEKYVQVEHVERPIDNFVQVFVSPPVAATCTATISK